MSYIHGHSEELSGAGSPARPAASTHQGATALSFPAESVRWYDDNANPVNEIIGKNGKPRSPNRKDAIELHLRPSVTSVLKVAAKFGLELWKQKQVMLSALTMPRLEGEDDESFCDRILFESREIGRLASERGTDLHGAIEKLIMGEIVPVPWGPHVIAVRNALQQYGIDIVKGKPEHTFVSPLGYGGKLDWHDDKVIIDFKTKDRITDKKKLAYPEHCYQLSAYSRGIYSPPPWHPDEFLNKRLINVFVGADDAAVRIHEWTPEDAEHGWKCFEALLNFWKLVNL